MRFILAISVFLAGTMAVLTDDLLVCPVVLSVHLLGHLLMEIVWYADILLHLLNYLGKDHRPLECYPLTCIGYDVHLVS